MAFSRNDPNRSCNSRISFDLEGFYQRLLGVFGSDPTALDCSVAKSHPSGWYDQIRTGCSHHSTREVDYLFSELLSKYSDGKTSEKLFAAAMERFYQAEEICRITNERLSQNEYHRFSFGGTAGAILYSASRKISNLLGDFSWDEAEDGMDWGPGATYSLPRTQSDPTYKFQGNLETTEDNLVLSTIVIRRSPLWEASLPKDPFTIVPGNKVITVPKNAKTDRVIAVEPRMNMFVQKGIGSVIRRRLKRVGIDINSQEENRYLALVGSIFDNLATIDLSMASDTVSRELVRQLLPIEWWVALEQCRSSEGVLADGTRLKYHKFSSMGNGYTFELETLIFWALASSVLEYLGTVDRRLAVYGDDIIISSTAAEALIEVLNYTGFMTNVKKTFIEGPFRESCGGHYLQGNDVTPFYIRRPVEDLFELFLLHNNLYRWFCRNRNRGTWSRPLARGLMMWIRSRAPYNWRKPRLPDGFGDGAFIGTFDEATPRSASSGFEGFSIKVLSLSTKPVDDQSIGLLLKSLHSLEKKRLADSLHSLRSESAVLPSKVGRARIVKILVPQFVLLDPFQEFPD